MRQVCLLTIGVLTSTLLDPAASAQVLGPSSGLLPMAPTVAAFEPAPEADAAGEEGRLFRLPALPEPQSGSLRLMRFSAPGAAAYRLYLESVALPEGARMYFYGLDLSGQVTRTFGPYKNSGPLAEGSFRSRVIPGVEVVIEIQGIESGPWPMRVPSVASINAGMLGDLRAANDPSLTETADQRNPPRGEPVQIELNGKLVTAEIIGDSVVIEGDMVVASARELRAAGGKGANGQSRFAVMLTTAAARWPGGVIPFDGPLKDDARAKAARDTWEAATNHVISFVPRTNESSFIRFSGTSENTCHSGVGRRQPTELVLGPTCSTGNARHEVGHAIGFHHEQSREDRDNFVTIITANIRSGVDIDANFGKKGGDDNTDIGPYDFGSIMHYPLTAFSKNGQNTIEPKVQVPAGVVVGQRDAPSARDVSAVNGIYGVRLSRSVLNVPSAGGTFSVSVAAPSDRFWVAVDDAPWVSLNSGISGTGNGTVQFTVASNEPVISQGLLPGLSNPGRTAQLSVALTPALVKNATLTIIQAASGCTYSVSPKTFVAEPDEATYSVTVTTPSHCTWGASEALSWVQLSPTSGQGTATVSVKVSPNNAATHNAPKRTGSITVAGQTVTITQNGGCVLCE